MKVENIEKLPKDNPLRQHLKDKKEINLIAGAFGNMADCAGIGVEITRPEEGGIYTKLLGCSYLYKGYPEGGVVEKLDVSKDMMWLFFKIANTWMGRIVLVALFILPKRFAKRFYIKWSEQFFQIAHRPLIKKMLKDRELCTSIRELTRVLNGLIQELPEKYEWIHPSARKIRELICMILEYDSAYKFRFQDVFPEFDPKLVKEDPIKELKRVFGILKRREVSKVMKKKWAGFEGKIVLMLRVSKGMREMFISFFDKVQLDRIKMDEADWYFCLKRTSYNYRDIIVEDRIKEKVKIDKEKGHQIPRLMIKQEAGKGPFF